MTNDSGVSISSPVDLDTSGSASSYSRTFWSTPGQGLTVTETVLSGSLAAYGVAYQCSNARVGSSTVMPGGLGTRFDLTPKAGDEITCTFYNSRPSTASKSFSPNSIAINGTSTLSITLTNPNSIPVTGVSFTDNYPTNLKNAATPALTNTCGGTAMAAAGGASLSLSGGTIPAGGSCTVSVAVTSPVAGVYQNTTGTIKTSNAATGAINQET